MLRDERDAREYEIRFVLSPQPLGNARAKPQLDTPEVFGGRIADDREPPGSLLDSQAKHSTLPFSAVRERDELRLRAIPPVGLPGKVEPKLQLDPESSAVRIRESFRQRVDVDLDARESRR